MNSSQGQAALPGVVLAEAVSPNMPTTDAAAPASETKQPKQPHGSMFQPGWQVKGLILLSEGDLADWKSDMIRICEHIEQMLRLLEA